MNEHDSSWSVRLAAGALLLACPFLLAMLPEALGGTAPQAESGTPPEEVVFSSHLGAVEFPHSLHAIDLEIECQTCHHEVDARPLHTPHPDYFVDLEFRCASCHHPDGPRRNGALACEHCHHKRHGLLRQTPSARAALHRACDKCHEIGVGAEASASCSTCHTGRRLPW